MALKELHPNNFLFGVVYLWASGNIGPYLLKDDAGRNVTVNDTRCQSLISYNIYTYIKMSVFLSVYLFVLNGFKSIDPITAKFWEIISCIPGKGFVKFY